MNKIGKKYSVEIRLSTSNLAAEKNQQDSKKAFIKKTKNLSRYFST
jgi:hypothetical protein